MDLNSIVINNKHGGHYGDYHYDVTQIQKIIENSENVRIFYRGWDFKGKWNSLHLGIRMDYGKNMIQKS